MFILNKKKTFCYINNKKINIMINTNHNNYIKEPLEITKEHFTNAPWISPNYFETKVNINENIIVPYYVTDYTQAEYLLDDNSKKFQIEIEFNGETIRQIVSAGDNSINIGSCKTLGEHYFTLECTDLSNKLKSYKHIIHLLCIDPNYVSKVYTMTTQDLATYSLNNTGSELDNDMTNNRLGLTQIMDDKKAQGYDKLVLLNGTYKVNPGAKRENAIVIPSNFTLDLNNSLIKHKFTEKGHACYILKFKEGSINSSMINGKVEGDYDEHDLVKPEGATYPIEGEGFSFLQFNGSFNSIENLEVYNITGYGIKPGTHIESWSGAIKSWGNYCVNLNGEEIQNSNFATCDFIDVTILLNNYNFIHGNTYLGYAGLSGKSELQYIHCYDLNKNYLGTIKSRQYSLAKALKDTKFVKITLYANSSDEIGNGSGIGYAICSKNYFPTSNCKIKNVYFHDTRTCSIAIGVYDYLLVEDCNFDRCGDARLPTGQMVTPLVIDIEDGYQFGQNYFFRNNSVGEDTSSTNLVVSHAHNIILENTNFSTELRAVRGLTYNSGIYDGFQKIARNSYNRTAFQRIQDCTFNADFTQFLEQPSDGTQLMPNVIKNCTFNSSVNNAPGGIDYSWSYDIVYKYCIVDNIKNPTIGYCTFDNCDIKLSNKYYTDAIFKNSKIYTKDGSQTKGCISGKLVVDNCEITNIDVPMKGSDVVTTVKNSTLTNVQSLISYWRQGQTFIYDNCTINNNIPLLKLPHYGMDYPIEVKNCEIISNSNKGIIEFYDDRINANATDYTLDTLYFSDNVINCTISPSYAITGLTSTTANHVKLSTNNNTLQGNTQLYDNSILDNDNITIL